tara:strand:+ start:4496 stop:5779 length:1284 start_codon:yes stop_codon:yes gene_type:complete
MTKFKVTGGNNLDGSVEISGAKNSLLPLICASLLSQETILSNAPKLRDAEILLEIMSSIGVNNSWEGIEDTLHISIDNIDKNVQLLQEQVSNIRYSTILMGALIGRGCKKIEIAYPGGCSSFGTRPIDIHLVGFEAFGADIKILEQSLVIDCNKLNHKVNHKLRFPSVGATLNLILASAAIDGEVILDNIAIEPEVIDLIDFCKKVGFTIEFLKERTIKLISPKNTNSSRVSHNVIPDRIETISYLVLGTLLCREFLVINNPNILHTKQPRDFLQKMGVPFDIYNDKIVVYRSDKLVSQKLQVGVYPKIGTDYQPIIAAAMILSNGVSEIVDHIYPKRFAYLDELRPAGVQSNHYDGIAHIIGNPFLEMAGDFDFKCHDLRAGFTALMFALMNDGVSILDYSEQILRGYNQVVEKLTAIGAKIEVID